MVEGRQIVYGRRARGNSTDCFQNVNPRGTRPSTHPTPKPPVAVRVDIKYGSKVSVIASALFNGRGGRRLKRFYAAAIASASEFN